MPGYGSTQTKLLRILSDGNPRSRRELIDKTGLTSKTVGSSLLRLWKVGTILRTSKPKYEPLRAFKGRAGIKKNTRAYHLYVYAPGRNSVSTKGLRFVKYDEKHLDRRGSRGSKAQAIRDFLEQNPDKALYSIEIAENLEKDGIKQRDVMGAVRRAERKGLVYV